MTTRSSFRTFLIGADTLLMECGDSLLARGHQILGVVTAAPRVARWARERNLPVVDERGDYHSTLAAQEFDLLLAITHLSILPAAVLELPRRAAINFHDGPLPRYAGLNAPVWALRQRETHYGITWHLMTAGIDEGAVLKQRLFELSPDETALSLNTKCFEAGLESFAELIDELAEGREQTRPQGSAGRSYFGRHDRPDQQGLLEWTRSAGELEAHIRAVNFDRYPNPLTTAKLSLHGRLFCVVKGVAIDNRVQGEPGEIVALDSHRVCVVTGDGALDVLEISTLAGESIPLADLTARFNWQVGDRCDRLETPQAAALTALNGRICRHEAFWLERLRTLNPAQPLPGLDSPLDATMTRSRLAIELPAEFMPRYGSDASRRRAALAALVGLYLARTGEHDSFDVAYDTPELRQTLVGFEACFAPRVPLRFTIDPQANFDRLTESVALEQTTLNKRLTWSSDLPARVPELHGKPGRDVSHSLAVALIVDPADETPIEHCPAPWVAVLRESGSLELLVDARRLDEAAQVQLREQFQRLIASLAAQPSSPVGALDLLAPDQREQLLTAWNDTARPYRREACIHHEFEEQVARTPDAEAVIFESQTLTYAALNARANQLAAHLRALGVGPDRLVGIHLERSLDLVVAVLAVHKAGGAYVPLDPHYPAERLAWMVEDARLEVIVTERSLASLLPPHQAQLVRIDADWPAIATRSEVIERSAVTSRHLAYVIYTSGSTGRPKGVTIEHRQAINFFVGMDEHIPHDPPGTWLAVTSLSFDISVLELLWTLSRGFRVVIHRDRERSAAVAEPRVEVSPRPMQFSLFYFSADAGEQEQNKYHLLLEGAKFADRRGFAAVWTPERHFHDFGGLYPHPAVTSAAVSVLTDRVQIRAGSVVLPLHHPIRVAEAWSVVDNLSRGRVGLSVASGWQPHDFVLRPENYADAKGAMVRDLDLVRRLWRGEMVDFPGATGETVSIRTLPRPIQPELPIWVTTAGNPETYRLAGELGANVLTHLLGQSVEELAPKIALYRQAREQAGFDPRTGVVSLMLHTFVADDKAFVKQTVRAPLRQYLGTSLSLLKKYAWAFPAFKRPAGATIDGGDEFSTLTPDEQDAMLDHAFERYFETSGLFGTPDSCLAMVERLKGIDVDEIACLVDFGIPSPLVLNHLEQLDVLRAAANQPSAGCSVLAADESIPGLIERYSVTHFQCTPSMARMLTLDDEGRAALQRIRFMFVGGEALPPDLAQELIGLVSGGVTNMYGPTETTVWSTTHRLIAGEQPIPIGRPIANTRLYILDRHGALVPPGATGELFIGGDGVVRGYWNRPELTAERFVQDPFVDDPAARMYRTGDLARYRTDGVVEFLGRADHQVKIRGHRIELGEIEARLTSHPAVEQSVVVAREVTAGDQRLVAYVVPVGTTRDESQLRDFVRQALPEFMTPSHVVFLDEFPLTPNGKIDRKALPALEPQRSCAAAQAAEPTNDVEAQLVALWRGVLGREQVGIDDNFFDLGGHSLLVVRLHRQLTQTIPQPVSLTDLYRFPTIRGLAQFLTGGHDASDHKASTDRGQKRREALNRRRKIGLK